MQIFYNSDCSKCREALYLLQSNGVDAEVIDYLNNPPNLETLHHIVSILGIKPIELVRKNEPIFIEKFIDNNFTDLEWLKILCDNPILIQRPTILDGYQAIIGRPPVLLLDLIRQE